MKALTIEQGSQARFVDIPEPVCGKGEVLINVERVGLCGSDLNTWRGLNPLVIIPVFRGMKLAARCWQLAIWRGRSNQVTGWSCCLALSVACAAPV